MATVFSRHGKARNASSRHRPMAEINITPFVDVMLVLLVVFMITAPLLTVGVPVDLPKASAQNLQGSEEPLTITVDTSGTVFLQETEVDMTELVPRLRAIAQTRDGDTRIFVRGDRAIDYGRVMTVMSTISAAGFNKVALVAEAPSAAK